MCGFLGEFIFSGKLLSKDHFISLNDLALARGPDSEGYWTNNTNCQLGFRRLSIRDLSVNGNQPMQTPSGRWHIVYNGEIYNHEYIKSKLPEGKYKFKGHSDTEIILYAFDSLGVEETIELLDGMFSIALFDNKEQELYLIRDFAGIKPLYYGLNNKGLVFASQYDQISKHPYFNQNNVKSEALKLYLSQHFFPAPHAILEDTFQVEAGKFLKIDIKGNIDESIYWEFPKRYSKFLSNEQEAINLIDNELHNSVRSELVSDVPVGTFLSGGIDSPLVTYYSKNSSDTLTKSYTIGSDSKIHDESEDAKLFAEAIGVQNYIENLSAKNVLPYFEEIMDSLKEPFADFSIIPTYLVSKFARKDVTVILSGDGGDELFYGYERFYLILKNFEAWTMPKEIRYAYYTLDKILFRNKHINSNFLFNNYADAHLNLHCRFKINEINKLFPDLEKTKLPEEKNFNYPNEENMIKLLNHMRKAEFGAMLQKTLMKVDRASMANSLEVRVPYLRKSFIESSVKLDPYLSYGRYKRKEILKKLLRSKLPDIHVDNTKRGFSIGLTKWIKEDLKDIFYDTIFSNSFIEKFNINKSGLSLIFDEHLENKVDHKWKLFTMFSLAYWYQNTYNK